MDDKVTPLREGRALLTDIPGMMRQVADQIEQGEIEASSMLVVVPRDGDWPRIFGWGEALSDLERIATMELAKLWFANNTTQRLNP